MKKLLLPLVFLFVVGMAPGLGAQGPDGDSAVAKPPRIERIPEKVTSTVKPRPSKPAPSDPSGHYKPGDRPGKPDRPGRPERPGKPDRPGKPGRPGKPDHRPGGPSGGSWKDPVKPGWQLKPDRHWRSRTDCWPYGCGDYYYNYYEEPEEPIDDYVEPEPRTYFSPGPFEWFDDPRDKE